MRQLSLFTTGQLAVMRDRTAARNYSAERDAFRREHERHRSWGLTQRHAERLRRCRASRSAAADACPPRDAASDAAPDLTVPTSTGQQDTAVSTVELTHTPRVGGPHHHARPTSADDAAKSHHEPALDDASIAESNRNSVTGSPAHGSKLDDTLLSAVAERHLLRRQIGRPIPPAPRIAIGEQARSANSDCAGLVPTQVEQAPIGRSAHDVELPYGINNRRPNECSANRRRNQCASRAVASQACLVASVRGTRRIGRWVKARTPCDGHRSPCHPRSMCTLIRGHRVRSLSVPPWPKAGRRRPPTAPTAAVTPNTLGDQRSGGPT